MAEDLEQWVPGTLKVPGSPAFGFAFYLEGNVETLKDLKQEGVLCLDVYFRKITLGTEECTMG